MNPFYSEREENVKADIFHAFIALLKQTKPSIGAGRDDISTFGTNQEISNLLMQQVPLIVKATYKQTKVFQRLLLIFYEIFKHLHLINSIKFYSDRTRA